MQSAEYQEPSDIGEVVSALRQSGAREVYTFRWLPSTDAGVREEDWFAVRGLPPQRFFGTLALISDILGRDVGLVDLEAETPFTRYLLESGELLSVR